MSKPTYVYDYSKDRKDNLRLMIAHYYPSLSFDSWDELNQHFKIYLSFLEDNKLGYFSSDSGAKDLYLHLEPKKMNSFTETKVIPVHGRKIFKRKLGDRTQYFGTAEEPMVNKIRVVGGLHDEVLDYIRRLDDNVNEVMVTGLPYKGLDISDLGKEVSRIFNLPPVYFRTFSFNGFELLRGEDGRLKYKEVDGVSYPIVRVTLMSKMIVNSGLEINGGEERSRLDLHPEFTTALFFGLDVELDVKSIPVYCLLSGKDR